MMTRLPTESFDKASEVIAKYNQELQRIRSETRLSDDGKKKYLQEAHTKATAEVEKIRREGLQTSEARVARLRRELFNGDTGPSWQMRSSADVVSYRDAQDRVKVAKTAIELGDIMEAAQVAGDKAVVRAGFARAWEESRSRAGGDKWRPLVDIYCEENRGTAELVMELEELVGVSPQSTLVESMATTVTTPAELRGTPGAVPAYGKTPEFERNLELSDSRMFAREER